MDARRRRLSPAVAVAAALLFFPMFFGSHTPAAAAAYGEASGDAGVTALQKHAAFFDKDGDGIVSLSETYDGLRALGLGSGLSSLSAAFINGVLSPKTRPVRFPLSLFLSLWLKCYYLKVFMFLLLNLRCFISL
jgi:peroxygenase